MKLELGSEVIGPLITFFAIHSTPEANQVKVTESLNVFTGLLSDILFGKQKRKKNNPLTLLVQESVVVCFAAFPLAVLVLVY